MTEEQFLDALAVREGLIYQEPPQIDQPTAAYGVTKAALEADLGRACTFEDLKRLAPVDAREVARRAVRREISDAGLNRIVFEALRYQIVDYGYESGLERAIRWLQRTVGVQPSGTLDDRTLAALTRLPAVVVNNALAGERAHAAYHGGVKEPNLQAGVARRAIDFVVALDEPMTT